MTTRRDFIKGFFSGVVLLGSGAAGAETLIRVYHKHDHYVGPKGSYNIWYVHQGEWHLRNVDAEFMKDIQQLP